MAFVDEVKDYLLENPRNVWEVPIALGCAFVESSVEDEHRWYNVKHTVFQKKTIVNQQPLQFHDEFVLVVWCDPDTELQDDDELEEPDVFAVEPYLVEVVKYRPV